jgi:hypothetical protein
MNHSMTTQELREQLTAHLDLVTAPPPDLDAVRRRSRGLRRRRLAGPAVLAVAAVGIGAVVLSLATKPTSPDDTQGPLVVATEDRLDLSKGLRAYASPDERLYLGGTSMELLPGMGFLDTDAVATPYGLVYMDPDGRTQLLGESGRPEPIGGASDLPRDWHPTAKADAVQPHVAFALMRGNDLELAVYDLEERSVVASTVVTCPEGCEDRVIDGIDSGAVFLRGKDGTTVWDYDSGRRYFFAGPKTRVADVRNGVVLYDGPAPTGTTDGWRLVPGAIDAQLTFDGEHALYWSGTLEPTRAGGDPIVLDEGPTEMNDGLAWWTVDTDGSVLVAVAQPEKPGGRVFMGDNVVYDCELPSGSCEELGPLVTTSGDPMFIGNDM